MAKRMMAAVNRTTLADAALELVEAEGIDALTMRTLAERTGVKAASLYWHVRDRAELLELVADALLARVQAISPAGGWREAAEALCSHTSAAVGDQRDGDRILLGAPRALRRSAVHEALSARLGEAGLVAETAGGVAAMLLWAAITEPAGPAEAGDAAPRAPRVLAIDSGSRGVVLRAGSGMDTPVRVPHDPGVVTPTAVGEERVTVRRLRGRRSAEVEIDPAQPWAVKVQGGTTNTSLDLRGIDIREIQLDSSCVKVECVLPRPRGVVPIHVSSGVVSARFHRPPGVPVVADVSSGSVKVGLDDYDVKVSLQDVHWETPGAHLAPHRYELRVSSGSVRISIDETGPDAPPPPDAAAHPPAAAGPGAIAVVLDGLAALRRGRHSQ